MREGYKKTEFGEIPVEWEIKKIGDVTNIINGGTPNTKVSMYWENGTIHWATPTDITSTKKYINTTEKYITNNGLKNSSANLLPTGSVLMTSRATIGECCINTVPMSTNQGIKAFVCKDIYNEFLYYLVLKMKDKLIKLAGGSTFLEISKTAIGSILIPIPSQKEQQKIAEILSTVDELIEQTDTLIEKTKELKKGLMQRLLTKGIGHTDFKKTEVGEIPVEWEVKELVQCGEFINGKAFKPSDWSNEGIPIIRIQNLNGSDEFNYFKGEIEEKYYIKPYDLLFSWSGSRGTSFGPHIWRGTEGVLNQHIFKVKINEGIDKTYLYYALKIITERIEQNAHGSAGLVHITKKSLESFKVPIPSLVEQKKIGTIINEFDEQIMQYKHKFDKLCILKRGLMQKLLTGKIRVKVS